MTTGADDDGLTSLALTCLCDCKCNYKLMFLLVVDSYVRSAYIQINFN